MTYYRILLTNVILLFSATFVSADVVINEENFPDEHFRGWVLSQEYGKDGVLTDEEIAGITFINVLAQNLTADGKIQSLKGIEFFTAMTKLNCQRNKLKELNLSKNTSLQILKCDGNLISELNLSNNKNLVSLSCSTNQLISLDVSGCTQLTELDCYSNKIITLKAIDCNALTTLKCYLNQLTELDVSGCSKLDIIWCYNNQLSTINVLDCKSLTTLQCNDNLLTYLDVSNNLQLKQLMCYNNQLTSLNLSKNKKLNLLRTFHNPIMAEQMDELIESLPIANKCYWACIFNPSEHSVMTDTRCAAAKVKGWIPQYWDESTMRWTEYKGKDDATGIDAATNLPLKAAETFDLQGRRIGKPQKGVNIIRNADGTTKKVLVKQ